MNGCELLDCPFWNGNRCTDERKFVNEYGDEVCGLRDDSILVDE